jgi:short subunit dehydrogenase-like uncharacterized protein
VIVLLGATGFTGELTARALARRGVPAVLAARSADRVGALAGELGLEHAVADVGQPGTVRALVGRGDVLISTVGPFATLGDAALEAAIEAGAHYIDSTGEASFIRRVFERGAEAQGALLTAFGFDYVPGNLAGALALRDAGGRGRRLDVGYFTTGPAGISGGTRASGAGMLVDDAHALRGGTLVREPLAARRRSFLVAGRRRGGGSLGGTEALALPRVAPELQDVTTYLTWLGSGVRAASAVVRLPGVRRLARRGRTGSSGGPDPEARAASRSQVVAEARDAGGALVGQALLTGPNPYDLTAELLAWAAERAAAGALLGRGALGPVDGFGLEALEAGCASIGLTPGE